MLENKIMSFEYIFKSNIFEHFDIHKYLILIKNKIGPCMVT